MVRRILPLVALTLLFASPALAQGRFEIHGFGGFRSGGSFDVDSDLLSKLEVGSGGAFGFSLGMNVTDGIQGELLLSRSIGQLDGTRAQAGGEIINLGNVNSDQVLANVVFRLGQGSYVPFVFGGAGIARVAPEGLNHEIGLAVNGGAGLRMRINDNVGLRFQGRAVASEIPAGEQIFCDETSGLCLRKDASSWMSVFEVTAGISFTFGGGGGDGS